MTKVLWDYLTSYVTWLNMCTMKYDWEKTGLKDILYKRSAISDYVGFQFYETVKYYRDGAYMRILASFWGHTKTLEFSYAVPL